MSEYTSEFIFFVLGLAGNFVVAALYDRYKAGQSAKAEAIRRADQRWNELLNSDDPVVRISAFQELTMQCLRWFILGNVMFAISGIAWVLEFAELYSASNVIASLTSLIAVLLFGRSLTFIKLFFRHRPSATA